MNIQRSSQRRKFEAIVTTLMLSTSLQAQAQVVDIASGPLAMSTSIVVRPNLMFILDDSGSMDWDYVPDDRGVNNVCFGYNGFNGVFFDPNDNYIPPLKADGTSYPNITNLASVPNDGYATATWNVDLTQTWNLSTPWVRVGTGTLNQAVYSQFYYATPKNPATIVRTDTDTMPCNDWSKWNYVTDYTTMSAAQRVNYGNWYAYYRKRMFMMRAAVGRVIGGIDPSRFRVGFTKISNPNLTTASGFLPIDNLDTGTQKSTFYSLLYNAAPSGSTPLRPALEKIGKYYAKKTMTGGSLPATLADPLQYACQRNYAILTTDGYWNMGSESSYRANYKPTRLDGATAIGNPDGGTTIARPYRDDGRTVNGNWVTGGAGVSNSLADVAQYFYVTDLRAGATGSSICTGSIAGQDVCQDIVSGSGDDTAKYQHMTTFTLGLGVAGDLTYQPDYDTASTGSFAQIKNGTLAWPDPKTTQSAENPQRADDLWHAAVNGRGHYYSASNPSDVVNGLSSAFNTISASSGVAAAAATSSLEPVNGDNFVFVGEYTTVLWSGNLKAMTIDTSTGAVSSTPLWQTKDTVKAMVTDTSDTRNIYFRNPTGGGRLSFTAANLTTAGLAGNFSNLCGSPYKISQCSTLVTLDANDGGTARITASNKLENVVNYLRGQSGFEDVTTNATLANRVFRSRPTTPLGDVINGAPVYMKKPPFKYSDSGYATYASTNSGRQAVVFLAANDGMLHAFDAATGNELWAYVPTMVMPKMFNLLDEDYATTHQYMVDGSPVVGDVYDGTQWHSILVGGLNAGGRGYYALDVTDPTNPIPLWELTNATETNLGLTYGNPVITKMKDGTWAVAFSSGYNNVSPGDGNGYLYVRNAMTGASIRTIPTMLASSGAPAPAGTSSAPSNLGKINAWVEAETDNTASRLYGGDMKGYIWRIDVNDNYAPSGYEATMIGRAVGPTGVAQPITTKPMLNLVDGGTQVPTVAIGTGRYLGMSDLGDTSVQSFYVFKDSLSATSLGTLRSNGGMVKRTLTSATDANGNTVRTISGTALDWSSKNGWFVDFTVAAGERINVNMAQAGRFLGVATNTPSSTACTPGGVSWLYTLDLKSGTAVDAMSVPALAAGLNVLRLGDTIRFALVDTKSQFTISNPINTVSPTGTMKRSSWRELVN